MRFKFLKKILFLLPIIFLLVLLGIADLSLTQDLGRHIKTGEIIVKCFCVPKINLYSYVLPDFPFINHHWLSEVFFYFIHNFFGFTGIFIFRTIDILFAFSLSYYIAYKKSPFWAFSLGFFFAYVLSERFDSRPEIFSFIFISVFLFLIEKFRISKSTKYLYPLPLIEFIWANSHIYFIVGIFIFGSLVVNEFFKKKISVKVLLLFGLTIFVTVLNPNGIYGGFVPFTIFGNYNYAIVENQNIFFLNSFFFSARVFLFEILSLIFILLYLANIKKNDIFYSLVCFFAIISSFFMIRNFPIFVLIALPYMTFLSLSLERKIKDKYLVKNIKIVLLIVLVIFVPYRIYKIVSYPIYGWGIVDGVGPSVDYFVKENLSGPIFNNFDVGGYLIYRLYPKEKIFVDARPEVYTKESFDEYKKIQEDPEFFKEMSTKYKFKTIIFGRNDLTPWGQKFLVAIGQNNLWKEVFRDDWMIIYVRK